MANYANFKTTVFEACAEKELRGRLVFGNLFTDYSDRIATEGKAIEIPLYGNVTVNDYSGTINTAELEDTKETLNIDKKKYFSIKVDDVDQAQAKGELIEKFASRGAYDLADAIDKEIAKVAGGKTGVKVTAKEATIVKAIRELSVKLTRKNVPSAGRFLVLSPEASMALINSLPSISTGENAFGVARENYIGKFAGFEIFESNNVNIASSTKHQCVAGVRESGAVAIQIEKTRVMEMESAFAQKVEGLTVFGCLMNNDRIGVLEFDTTAGVAM